MAFAIEVTAAGGGSAGASSNAPADFRRNPAAVCEIEAYVTTPPRAPMSNYVDGFVVPVPRAKLDAYRDMAERAGKLWMEHGAFAYWEGAADDVKPGKVTSFPQSVQLKEDEIVVFSWIAYESREARDRVNARVMEVPRMKGMMDSAGLPFDGTRFYGGFKRWSIGAERRLFVG